MQRRSLIQAALATAALPGAVLAAGTDASLPQRISESRTYYMAEPMAAYYMQGREIEILNNEYLRRVEARISAPGFNWENEYAFVYKDAATRNNVWNAERLRPRVLHDYFRKEDGKSYWFRDLSPWPSSRDGELTRERLVAAVRAVEPSYMPDVYIHDPIRAALA